MNSIAQVVLGAMQRKHIYAGTVTDKVKSRRRAANKRARASRRINRGQK